MQSCNEKKTLNRQCDKTGHLLANHFGKLFQLFSSGHILLLLTLCAISVRTVIGTLIKEFNDHDELVGMNFHKINDLDPFPDAFDCEMDPDYIDGGHGIQVWSFPLSCLVYVSGLFLQVCLKPINSHGL